MKIQGEAYTIEYNAAQAVLHMQGIMRLKGNEYAPLAELLEHILQQMPPVMNLDLHQLDALNSSGITVLAKFVAQLNQLRHTHLVILASPTIAWQKKSLGNFQRLMPNLHTRYKQEQIMEVKGEGFNISYNPETRQIYCQGIMRLRGAEYRDLEVLLEQVLQTKPPQIILDLSELQSLNSSGITTLARFVANLHKQTGSSLTIRGDQDIAWQKKSVKNFQRLMPTLQFEWSTAS